MPRLGPGCSAAHTCLRMRMRLQELDWPWGSRKVFTLSRRWVTVQLTKEYRDMRSTQVSVSSWWKVSSACRWSDSCSEYCCCCPRSDSTEFLLHHEVGLFKLLLNINSKTLTLHFYKIFSLGQSALEEPHDDDVASKGDGVVVELEGVSVGPTL